MRTLLIGLVLTLSACATGPVKPREYLDEDTAATVTVVGRPFVFAADHGVGVGSDFLSVYAIDVNRMGQHQQYLVVQQSTPVAQEQGSSAELTLDLMGQTISLRATSASARELGISKPVAPAYGVTSKWWYFPTDKATLIALARSERPRATMTLGSQQTSYVAWSDGRTDLVEFTAVLPQ